MDKPERSALQRPLIVIVFVFLGLIISFGYIFGSEFMMGLKEHWENKN